MKSFEITLSYHRLVRIDVQADRAKKRSDISYVKAYRLSGMVNYSSQFLPNLRDLMKSLRLIMHKVEEWQLALDNIKPFFLISSTSVSLFQSTDEALHPERQQSILPGSWFISGWMAS